MATFVQEFEIAEFDGTLESMSCFPEEERKAMNVREDGRLSIRVDSTFNLVFNLYEFIARDYQGNYFGLKDRKMLNDKHYIPKEVYIRREMIEESAEHQAEVAKEVEEDLADREMRMEFEQESENSFLEICDINRERILKLIEYGALSEKEDAVRDHNVGKSDYSEHTQTPWSIWKEYELDPWRADILKRTLRHKEGDSEEMDLQKIIHIAQELLRQLKNK